MEKKLSKKALSKSFHNWYYGHLTCFSQEHMQTFGYLCSMLPLVEELYDNEEIYQRKLTEKYNPANLFKNKETKVEKIENSVAMVEYKESTFTKIKNWFKRTF